MAKAQPGTSKSRTPPSHGKAGSAGGSGARPTQDPLPVAMSPDGAPPMSCDGGTLPAASGGAGG